MNINIDSIIYYLKISGFIQDINEYMQETVLHKSFRIFSQSYRADRLPRISNYF
jgi:hypothetical protein